MNITVDVKYACYIMFSFAIFVSEEICYFWPSPLERLLVGMRTSYGKKFTCSTDQIDLEKLC